jgi:hypothetical protein
MCYNLSFDLEPNHLATQIAIENAFSSVTAGHQKVMNFIAKPFPNYFSGNPETDPKFPRGENTFDNDAIFQSLLSVIFVMSIIPLGFLVFNAVLTEKNTNLLGVLRKLVCSIGYWGSVSFVIGYERIYVLVGNDDVHHSSYVDLRCSVRRWNRYLSKPSSGIVYILCLFKHRSWRLFHHPSN